MINEDSNCKHTIFWGDFYGFQYINQLYRKSPKIYKYSEITKIIHNATKQDIIDVAIFFYSKIINNLSILNNVFVTTVSFAWREWYLGYGRKPSL